MCPSASAYGKLNATVVLSTAAAKSGSDLARMTPSKTRPIWAAVFQNDRVLDSAHPVLPFGSQRRAMIGDGIPACSVRYTVVVAVAYTGGVTDETGGNGLSTVR